jgi:sulfide dehydrogenase [flavocytochrome c] flavoprotein chain
MTMQRRDFLKFAGASLAGALASASAQAKKTAGTPHIVVVGAGFGGATCAKYIRMWDPKIKVTLIESNAQYFSCPMTNWVLGGLRTMEETVQSYKNLPGYGINMVHDTAG